MLSHTDDRARRGYWQFCWIAALLLLASACGRTALHDGSDPDASSWDATVWWDGPSGDTRYDATPDSPGPDAATVDTALGDLGAMDGSAGDAVTSDVNTVDGAFADAGPTDSTPWDAPTSDVNTVDGAWPDVGTMDSALPDSALPDSALPDSALPDSALPRPDLVISAFSARVRQDDNARYTARVCNVGNLTAVSTQLALYYNRSAPPGAWSFPNATVAIPQLRPGRCATVRHSVRLTVGEHRSWARADHYDVVTESNENNNLAGPIRVLVEGPPPDPCVTVCSTLIDPCGIIGDDALLPCLLVCYTQPQSAQDCALKAAESQRCLSIVTCFVGN